MRGLFVVVVLAAALTGCTPTPEVFPSTTAAPTTPEPPVQAPEPTSVTIPSLGIDSGELVALDLDADRRLQAPDVHTPEVGGWYADGVRPGDVGPAVIAAHVSGRPLGAEHSVPGLFARLHEIGISALVHVRRVDGSTVLFQVTRVEHYAKTSFPRDVYADTKGPELRLITCGGEWDAEAHSYRQNVVVYAKQV